MKILWITNIILPPACEAIGVKAPVVGGWMLSSAKMLVQNDTVELAVATVYNGSELKELVVDNITYFLLPSNGVSLSKYNKGLEKYWQQIKESYLPDVIHVHGTEYPHGLAYIKACSNTNVVVSIQGLVHVIQKYYLAGIDRKAIIRNITFRDIVRWDNIFQQKNKIKLRGRLELEYIRSVNHIIGRTVWDNAHIIAVNPDVNYHFCNETLRSSFYSNRWSYDKCEKHSIFLSQADYPIKGLHIVLKAVSYLAEKFPDIKIYVAGNDFINTASWKSKIKLGGYGKYIKSLIKELELQKRVTFTGLLNEEQMCDRYMNANLFICPSSIENSPNSLGEAQILGVPFLASYVGGTPDMVNSVSSNLLYRFDDAEILAMKISEIFELNEWEYSEKSVKVAGERHDRDINNKTLIDIYKKIGYNDVNIQK